MPPSPFFPRCCGRFCIGGKYEKPLPFTRCCNAGVSRFAFSWDRLEYRLVARCFSLTIPPPTDPHAPPLLQNSLQPQRPPPQQPQMHIANNGPPGPNGFRPLGPGPAGNNGAWGGGVGPERFPPGFGAGPPGHGNVSPPWFEGQPPQQQQMQQMRPHSRQHFAPGAGGPGGGAMGGPGGNMNNGMGDPGGMRRSRSPDPRDGPLENKMPRLR